jgi:hypothetical protein
MKEVNLLVSLTMEAKLQLQKGWTASYVAIVPDIHRDYMLRVHTGIAKVAFSTWLKHPPGTRSFTP